LQQDDPEKELPETDAIFEHIHEVNRQADSSDTDLRLSWDTKAALKIGLFSRGGLFWEANRHRFPLGQRLVLNQDNGPENNSRRTQYA